MTIEELLERQVRASLSRFGVLKTRQCGADELSEVIRYYQSVNNQHLLKVYKALQAAMKRYGVVTPDYLPYKVLEKIVR